MGLRGEWRISMSMRNVEWRVISVPFDIAVRADFIADSQMWTALFP